ncbi:MAG TPA: hypothetical protein VMX33_13845 [bacterium]|nr:hypothetical protein [bacterium]
MTDFEKEYNRLIEKIRSVPDYHLICEQLHNLEPFEKKENENITIKYSTEGSM